MRPEATLESQNFITTIPITEQEFVQIRDLVKTNTGITLGTHKRDLVISRLAQRLRTLGLTSFSQYLAILKESGDSGELVNMINRITTNKTDFFRENHHFEYLRDIVLPEVIAQSSKSGEKILRAWSAGCSSGQEPYTLAVVLKEFFNNYNEWNPRILATDLDTNILNMAREGVYKAEQVQPIPEFLVKKYFTKLSDGNYQIKPVLKDMIIFRRFNFMNAAYKMKVKLDFIFCRNVMIYFEPQDKFNMVKKFYDLIKDGGYLFVGHSESLMMAKDYFVNVGPTIYRKV